ncbi:MAG: 50S ribosomal protein L18 [Planctomycetota bacterium]
MKTKEQTKRLKVRRRRARLHVRERLKGKRAPRPRLSVFRSHKHIYGQLIDDEGGRTLAAASSLDKQLDGKLNGLKKTEVAAKVGMLLGERAKGAGIEVAVFDRGRFKFHGRVRALAEAAVEAGLEF